MNRRTVVSLAVAGPLSVCLAAVPHPLRAHPQQQPATQASQITRTEGKYVQSAYNNEGYVIVGYQAAATSLGDAWMLLEIGTTLRDNISEYTLNRDAISLVTPAGVRIALASVDEFRKANLQALDARADVIRDSINYFPNTALKPCWIGFFSDQASRTLSWEQVVVSSTQACRGRVYFKAPGGIRPGTYSLDVRFRSSVVRVPFTLPASSGGTAPSR